MSGASTRASSRSKSSGRVSEKAQLDMDDIQTNLNAQDWESRLNGLEDFAQSAKRKPAVTGGNVKVTEQNV